MINIQSLRALGRQLPDGFPWYYPPIARGGFYQYKLICSYAFLRMTAVISLVSFHFSIDEKTFLDVITIFDEDSDGASVDTGVSTARTV